MEQLRHNKHRKAILRTFGCVSLAATGVLAGCTNNTNTPTVSANLNCIGRPQADFFLGVNQPGATWGANVRVSYGHNGVLQAWAAMTQRTLGYEPYSKYIGGEGTTPAHASPTVSARPGDLITNIPSEQGVTPIVKIYAEENGTGAQNSFSIRCNDWAPGDPEKIISGPTAAG